MQHIPTYVCRCVHLCKNTYFLTNITQKRAHIFSVVYFDNVFTVITLKMHRILKLTVITEPSRLQRLGSFSDLTCPRPLNILIAVARQNKVLHQARQFQARLFRSEAGPVISFPQEGGLSSKPVSNPGHGIGHQTEWGLKFKYQVSLTGQSLACIYYVWGLCLALTTGFSAQKKTTNKKQQKTFLEFKRLTDKT